MIVISPTGPSAGGADGVATGDAGVSSSGQPYLILEYVQGVHIDQYCDKHKLDLHARIKLFLEVLDAVAHAHAAGVLATGSRPYDAKYLCAASVSRIRAISRWSR